MNEEEYHLHKQLAEYLMSHTLAPPAKSNHLLSVFVTQADISVSNPRYKNRENASNAVRPKSENTVAVENLCLHLSLPPPATI